MKYVKQKLVEVNEANQILQISENKIKKIVFDAKESAF